ncbi:thaumatin family-domain-containing protein [Mycena rosella]|uniref:Thaumatin family-domain-containing protein n=1 Tax=Mycena rosella TaxID=1033263 RepID=A0AAD7BJ78_MYCRO|nr:thaumatin family-domain-containing protein [Mycena rosella]
MERLSVSLVDGFNVPVSVVPGAGSCHEASCTVDLNPKCTSHAPPALGPGRISGCKSACSVNVDRSDSPNCCSGSHNVATTCPPSGVQWGAVFQLLQSVFLPTRAPLRMTRFGCPDSYADAYGESSKTALWTCDSTLTT